MSLAYIDNHWQARMTSASIDALKGRALNWAVARCIAKVHHDEALNGSVKEGWWISGLRPDPDAWIPLEEFDPSSDAALVESIIRQHNMGLMPPRLVIAPNGSVIRRKEDGWFATTYTEYDDGQSMPGTSRNGPTPFIAAMRCCVSSHYGEGKINVPEALLAEMDSMAAPMSPPEPDDDSNTPQG